MEMMGGKAGRKSFQGLLAVLVVAALVALSPVTGLAATSATLRFSPQPLSVETGAGFSVDVWVDDVANLYGAQVYIDFDPSILEVTKVQNGTLLAAGPMSSLTYDNTLGHVDIQIVQIAPSAPVSGSGALATISFRGKASGTSPLQFVTRDDKPALSTLLTNENGGQITCSLQNGQVTAYSLARLEITPASAAVAAGKAITYVARVYDSMNALVGTVTGSTVFSIDSAAGGTWLGATYVSANSGTWTVSGTYTSPGGKRLVGTAQLTVTPASAGTLSLAGPVSLTVGGQATIVASLTDATGNPVADGTAVTFTCTNGRFANGSTTYGATTVSGVAQAVFTATTQGTATIAASAGDASDSLQLAISAANPPRYTVRLPIVARSSH